MGVCLKGAGAMATMLPRLFSGVVAKDIRGSFNVVQGAGANGNSAGRLWYELAADSQRRPHAASQDHLTEDLPPIVKQHLDSTAGIMRLSSSFSI